MLSLPENTVHVWSAALDGPAGAALEALRALLDADEAARAARFHFEHDRRHYIVARGWLRTLAGAYLGIPPGDVRFGYRERGKPFLIGPSEPLRFNVSHSHGRALLAFARGREVGVDVEAGARLGDDWPGLVRRVFSPREQAELGALPVERQRAAFLDGWTRKEAYLKATGLGITAGLQTIEVTLDPARPPVLRRPAPEEATAARAWTIHDLRTEEAFAAALVVEGAGTVQVERRDVAEF